MTRYLWMAAGSLNVGLGVAGMFLPLLPTTPFLLLAGVCYAKSSPHLHLWLMEHRVLGSYIRSYHQGQGMPLRAKISSIVLLWITLGGSMWWMDRVHVWWLFVLVGAGVTAIILWCTRPRVTAEKSFS